MSGYPTGARRKSGHRRTFIDDDRPSQERYDAGPFVPDATSLDAHRRAAELCRGCPLHVDTTGTVFGTGAASAMLMLVGEQPGDVEDREGEPFVGPAGRVLQRCLDEADIRRDQVYLTNAVKHFKHHREGKRRIHDKPNAAEIEACHPWLAAELLLVDPAVVVALGATGARALMGKPVKIEANLDELLHLAPSGTPMIVTYHPSAALRRQEQGEAVRRQIVESLIRARDVASG